MESLLNVFEKNNEFSFGVYVDNNIDPFLTPPKNLKKIGFVLVVGNDGLISENLLDLIISYKLNNIEIMLECPIDIIIKNKIEANYLVSLAGNVGFSLSILPPSHPFCSELIEFHLYSDFLDKITKEMLIKSNFDQYVYPISNFMEYLFMEYLIDENKKSTFFSSNDYMINNFIKFIEKDDENKFKESIRQEIYSFYEGKDKFDLMAKEIMLGIYDVSEKAAINFFNLPKEVENNSN